MADGATGKSTIIRSIDYIFGRNSLIGIASLMLLFISGYATWHGMRDFIVGVSSTTNSVQTLPGGMSFSNDFLVIAVVFALTFLMWLALRETFGAKRKFSDRIITGLLYVFLAIWSIGFGYGFWWSLISGEEATRTGLSGLQEDARDASTVVAARLDAVRAQLDNVVTWSDGQMTREETSGGSCGKPSGAGKGPLYNARRGARDAVSNLRNGMTKSWIEPVQADVELLKQAASSLDGGTVEERQKNFENKASEIRGKARSIASRSNELGKSTASEMRALAASVSVPPDKAGFSCYDPTLAQRLTQAADQAEQPADLKLREAVFNEGPAGVANAVKNLWRNIGTYTSSLVSYMVTGSSGGHIESGEPITGRDMIALLATIGIDIGLLVLAILNPPPAASLQLSREVARRVEESIDTAIKDTDDGVTKQWIRGHFVHHREGSYMVIPNLASADANGQIGASSAKNVKNEPQRALAMNHLAGVLMDMGLIRWPNPGMFWKKSWGPTHDRWPFKSELHKLKKEELKSSATDLSTIGDEFENKKVASVRNKALFSKASQALKIADWSDTAQNDFEIFPVVEVDGLTPLLMVLNESKTYERRGELGLRDDDPSLQTLSP
jgi:hypothetical protein